MNGWSRYLENAGFVLAVLLGGAYVVIVEITPRCAEHRHGFPWGLLAVLTLLVAPKTLGRATAGKLWDRLSGTHSPPKE